MVAGNDSGVYRTQGEQDLGVCCGSEGPQSGTVEVSLSQLKVNGEGEVFRAKTTVVAKGFSQVSYLDFAQTLVPTPQSPLVSLVLAVVVQQDLDLFHFDAQQAFVQSDMKEKV